METTKLEIQGESGARYIDHASPDGEGWRQSMSFKVETSIENGDAFRAALAKFAKKYGKALNAVADVTTTTETRETKPDAIGRVYTFGVLVHIVDLVVPSIRHNGFIHVATLKSESLEDGTVTNVVFPAKQFEKESFVKYFAEPFRCDHCRTNRRGRKTVHLWRNETTGVDLIIAASCSKQYFGEDLSRLLRGFETLSPESIGKDIDEMVGSFGGGRWYIDVAERAEYAALVFGILCREKRYLSNSRAFEIGRESTQTAASWLSVRPSANGMSSDHFREVLKSWEEKRALALEFSAANGFDYETLKAFWTTKAAAAPDDNFARNTALNFSLSKYRAGILAFSVFDYMKNATSILSEKVAASAAVVSNHVGTVGDRLRGLVLAVVRRSSWETPFGMTFMFVMVDQTGNRFVWRASSCAIDDETSTVTLDGTVKSHTDFKGTKQTDLSRCKVTELASSFKAKASEDLLSTFNAAFINELN